MTIEKTEFTFPDDASAKTGDDAEPITSSAEAADEIEIVDDTPEADRGRVPMETPPEDPTEEELQAYSKRDRNRIKEFTRGYHDERRAREARERELAEALNVTKAVMEENQRLRGNVSQSQATLLEQAKKQVATELAEAKAKYKAAYETGDADGVAEATSEIAKANTRFERVHSFKPPPLQAPKVAVQPENQTEQPVAPPDPKAEAWLKLNKWWGQDEEMTALALAVHNKLVTKDRVDPRSDDYYRRLDRRLREVFPDKFASEDGDADATQRTKANVVAPATRSVAARKITLSASEVAIAKRLNIPLETYAREVAALRGNRNG